MDHWASDCPQKNIQYQGQGQSSSSGVNDVQPTAKGKNATTYQKGQSKGYTIGKQTAGVKGKGNSYKGGKKGGRQVGKAGRKGKVQNPQAK